MIFLRREDRDAWLIVTCVFVALCVAKLLLVAVEAHGPTILNDELVYARYARALAEKGSYKGTNYPLLYPFLISLCLKAGTDFYAAIKAMNIVLSSLVVFPAYMLARLVLPRKESLLCVAVAAMLPFHLVFPRQIMSENVYFPLLLFTLYLCVRVPGRNDRGWDALLGACLGLLFLTRFLTIPLLPAFALTWLVTNWQPGWRPWLRGLAIVGVFAVVVSPWFAMGLSNGVRFDLLVGMGIADNPVPGQRTFERLAIWSWLYASYYILLAAAFLHFMLLAIPGMARGLLRGDLFRYRVQIGILLLVALFAVAVVRHSWNSFYNYPGFVRIMGRYLVYFPPLFAIVALAALNQAKGRISLGWIIAAQAVALVLLALAFATLVPGEFVPLGSRFITDRGSVDVYNIRLGGMAWLLLVSATIVISGLLLRYRPGWAAPSVVLGALLAMVIGYPEYHRHLRIYAPQTIPASELHSRGITDGFVVYTRHLKPIEGRDPGRAVKTSYRFWGLKGEQAKGVPDTLEAGRRHFIVGPTADLAGYEAIDVLRVFESRGEEYRLIEVGP